ncbi:MAG: Uma2 family endonuclease [Anaerolineae bacterium]|nr:Uma2 family endonuclease [Anaerolineae bacterium]
MSAPSQERISQAEFNRLVALPENQDRHLELWNGEIVETMPRRFHAIIQNLFAALFFNYLQQNPIGTSYTEFQIQLENEDYAPIPDVCIVLKERDEPAENDYLRIMPDLVVEIQSPGQSDQFMRDKADYYLQRGCRMVILVYEKPVVEALTPTTRALLLPGETLTGGDVLPDFSLEIARIFPARE